jgi:hypothetical protein
MELPEINDRYIELILDRGLGGGTLWKILLAVSIAGDHKLQEYLERVDHHSETLPAREGKSSLPQKEGDGDQGVAGQIVEAKRERKEAEKAKEYQLAALVRADVQAFEDSNREHKITHHNKMK